uniref:Uncharacterized protein n=1 Tax=Panagrolaimus superbus TaxID=310955 RepID=A0A914ZD12_9BILA
MSWIPGISQLKSAVQLVTGDVEGAAQTQKEFFQRCPVVSQVTSTVQFVAGDTKGAVETQKACLRTVSDVADGIPVVGHVKGIAHYVCNDEEGGDRAMKAATRTTAVTAAGAGGFLIGGPVGAVAGGVYGGAAYDTAHSAVTDKPQGLFQAVDTAVNNPNGGNIFDAVLIPVSDGFAGHAGGQMVNKMNVLSMQKKLDKMSNQMTDGMGKMSGAEALKLGDNMMQLDSKLSNAKGVHYVPGPKGRGSVAVQASPLPAAPVTYVKEQTYQKGRISSGTIYTKSNRTSAPRRTATTNNVAAVTNTANNASQNGNSSESEDEQRHNKKECGGETTDTEDENEKQQRVTAKRLNAEAEKSLRNSNVTRSGLVEDIQNCIRAWRKLVLQMGHRLSREELIKVEQEMKNLNEMLHFVVVDEMLFCLTETVTERTKKMLKAFFECVKKIKMMYKRCLNVIRSILSPIMKSPNSISTIDDERFEQLLNQIHAIPTTEFIAFLQTCNFRFPASSNRRMIDFYQDIARFIGSLEGAAFRPETNTLSPTPGQTNATFAVFSR